MSKTLQQRSGILFVITAPSGSGKSTICQQLLDQEKNLSFSVSFTSRKPRKGEVDGVHYHFISAGEFKKKRDSGDFLEWAIYADNYYGTCNGKTKELLQAGKDLLLDIEVQGAMQIKEKLKEDAVLIFILPPSMAILQERLRKRGKNTAEELEKRVDAARDELRSVEDFQYCIVNDDLRQAVASVRCIIESERRKVSRNNEGLRQVLRSFNLDI